LIHEETKSRLYTSKGWYRLVQNLLPSCLLYENINIEICKTIILPVVLYKCKIWSVILREEHTQKIFENKALRGIFGLKRDEIVGDWRKLHNKELHNRPIKSKTMRRAGHVASMGIRGMHVGFDGKARRRKTTK
jgi:PAS domain-containing protein